MEFTSSAGWIEPDKVCPFRTITKNIQISQVETYQVIEYPECYYNKCSFFQEGECELAKVKLARYLKK